MTTRGEKRRYPRRKPFASQSALKARTFVDDSAVTHHVKLVDLGGGGLSIQFPHALENGSIVDITGEIEDLRGRQALEKRCHVISSRPSVDGSFVIGLAYEKAKKEQEAGTSADYYELLQVSRGADFDTIQRVFRILAQRYHPDNQQTGNPDVFQTIVEAHRVLSDPERRAAYDLQTRDQAAARFKLFDSWRDTQGPEAERRIRRGILTILYRQRQTNPREPHVSLIDLGEALGVPREHLEFSLWFLRESKSLRSADNGRVEITHTGVLVTEADEHRGPGSIHQFPAIEAAPHTL